MEMETLLLTAISGTLRWRAVFNHTSNCFPGFVFFFLHSLFVLCEGWSGVANVWYVPYGSPSQANLWSLPSDLIVLDTP